MPSQSPSSDRCPRPTPPVSILPMTPYARPFLCGTGVSYFLFSKENFKQGRTPHTPPLLQRGVPPTGDSPPRTAPTGTTTIAGGYGFGQRITESQNCIGWKRPLRSSSPTINLTLPRPPLHHVPKHLIQTSFKCFQGWRLNHFPGQPGPMLDNPFREVKFPNIQSKPPLVQLEAISSCPITCYLGEETDPTSLQPPFSNKVSPQPPFLQAEQPQFPQPLPISLVLQTLHQLRCPSLDTLQPLNVSLGVRGPTLNTVFEGHDHCPSPAGHAIFDTSQDAVGFLGHLGTLLAHIQVAVNQHSQVLFRLAAFQPLFPKPVALHGVAVAQVQDLALGLVKPHTIDLSPSIQPVQVPLQSLPTLQQINTPTQLGVICKLTEGALDPFVQIIDEDVKQDWPQHRALGNTACDRPPTGFSSIHHHSLGPAIQPVLYPVKSKAKQPQFPQPLPISLVLQTLHQLRCPSLDTLQPLNVSLGVRGPKLNTAFE
ncbi:hypothetical protein QYF61_027910, partial [Mycteria americana]